MNSERLVKRYTNRKLYDTLESRYVTLEEIARLVREGEEVTVVDNETNEDLTAVTFAQIILEEERRKTNFISVPFLRRLIRTGEARVQDLSDRASRSIEVVGELAEKAGQKLKDVVDEGSKAFEDSRGFVDGLLGIPQKRFKELGEAARKSVESVRSNPTVQRELERIASSLHSLERSVERLRAAGQGEHNPAAAEGESSAARYANGGHDQREQASGTSEAGGDQTGGPSKASDPKGGHPDASKTGI